MIGATKSCSAPFQQGFLQTQQPQGDEPGAQTNTALMLGQIKPWKSSSGFSNVGGRALFSGSGAIAFCCNISDYPDI